MRFRIELILDSTVYTVSHLLNATFRAFSFENGTKGIGLVRSRVNRRPVQYEMKTVTCK